jgi:hypothetical protein
MHHFADNYYGCLTPRRFVHTILQVTTLKMGKDNKKQHSWDSITYKNIAIFGMKFVNHKVQFRN